MNKAKETSSQTATSITIFLYIILTVLFIESIVKLFGLVGKGIFKKEILSKNITKDALMLI